MLHNSVNHVTALTLWSGVLRRLPMTCMAHYENELQSSIHRLPCLHCESKEKWQQQIGFLCVVFHHWNHVFVRQVPSYVQRLQKWDFLWAEFSLEALFPLCRTLLWLELHTTAKMCVRNLFLSSILVHYRYATPEKKKAAGHTHTHTRSTLDRQTWTNVSQ